MKQLIMDVLDDMSTGQINLESEASRKLIANTIMAAIKSEGGWFLDLSTFNNNSKLDTPIYEKTEEQKARETWVCSICGENTFEVDYDYLGSGTNHLGCELKSQEEIDEYVEDIDEQAYAQGRGSSKDVRREKNSSQKKHEDKVFGGDTGTDADFGHDQGGNYEIPTTNDDSDIPEGLKRAKELAQEAIKEELQKRAYLEMTSDGLPEGGDTQAVLESHKLADEIVDNKDEKWIYESPDGGKTVFRRPFSDYDPEKKVEIDWETKEPTGRKFTEYNNGNWRSKDEG